MGGSMVYGLYFNKAITKTINRAVAKVMPVNCVKDANNPPPPFITNYLILIYLVNA